MTVLVFALSVWRGYDNYYFLFREAALETALTNLSVYLGVALGISVLIQVVVHITHKKQERPL